ncbi:MAG: glycosyltransferase [Desulfobacterales bacterium]|nr:glycosyltransferase [Desulfobacterales bacterium]
MQVTKELYAPIVLFVYNRPDHVQTTVKSLQQNRIASNSDLFIYADGPKGEISKDKVAEVRNYINTITGFKKITIVEQKKNKGLANSIIQGVTEIVNRYDRVIVLEDDLETSPDFLRYMNKALNEYEDEPQVMQISGHMFNVLLDSDSDAVFLPFTNSIGWAIWKRSWDFFDPLISGYEKIRDNKELKYRFNLDGTYNYFQMLEKQLDGKIDSWAIRWYVNVFLNNGLVLYPAQSLIKHIGFDERGTHAKNDNSVYAQFCSRLPNSNIHFPPVKIDFLAYDLVKACLASRYTNDREVGPFSVVRALLEKTLHFFRS